MTENYFSGEHFEGFGDKWGALYNNAEEFFCEKLTNIIQESSPYFYQKIDEKDYLALIMNENEPISLISLLEAKQEANEFISFYPKFKGIPTEITLKDYYQWKTIAEGDMAGKINIESINLDNINFFNQHYAKDINNFEINKKINVSLSGLAFHIEKLEEKEFKVETGALFDFMKSEFLEKNKDKTEKDFEAPIIKLDSEHFRMFVSSQYTCEYEAVGIIEEIDYTDFFGTKVAVLKVNFSHNNKDEKQFYLNVYASENVLKDYVPQIGDGISTVMWISGYFEETENENNVHF